MTFKPGSAVSGRTFSGVRLDLELTGNAIAKLTLSSSGTITVTQPNLPPQAAISADVTSGAAPLTVNLDASGSSDDGSIVKYEWDFDTDGNYDQDTGATPTVTHIYSTEGYVSTTVRVTDNTGLTATASVTIAAGITYDEVENNDTTGQANGFPAFPFSAFYGSSGSGTGYPGYDGDGTDYFSFNASIGQTVDLTMTLPPVHGDIDMKLYDSTIGPRFSNPKLVKRFGDDQMPQTADTLAREYGIYGFCYYHYWFNGKLLLEQMITREGFNGPFTILYYRVPPTDEVEVKALAVGFDAEEAA